MGFAAGKRGIAGPRLVGLAVVLAAILLGACDGGASARPTEPRELLATAIRTTAHLPSLRLHVEMVSDMGQLAQGMPNATMHLVYDFDVDLGGRQLAGKSTMQFPAGVPGGPVGPQVIELIVTRDASFQRQDPGGGRWTKLSGGLGGGPTNAAIADALLGLLDDPANLLEVRGETSCSLGTCDDIAVRVDGGAMRRTLGPLLDPTGGAPVPSFDGEVLVDQASSVISEVRLVLPNNGGMSQSIRLVVSNPGAPVVIAAPPADQVDDIDGGMFGGGGAVIEPQSSVPPDLLVPDESAAPE
jgi:hypothetical protein